MRKPNNPNNPCYQCGDRKVTRDYNCHSHCKKYLAWKQKKTEVKKRADADKESKVYQIERTIAVNDVKRKVRKGHY